MAKLNFSQDSVKGNSKAQLVELGNGVVQITMNDEENRNNFSQEMVTGLFQCFQAVRENQNYKVVILAGTNNYFGTGVSGEQLMSTFQTENNFSTEKITELLTLALNCPIPVIAAIEGHALGGGFAIGLYADLLVLSQESFYASNFLKYGFIPGAGAIFILLKKLGLELGKEMVYTACNYRGEELEKRGVPFPVLPRKEVLKFARKIANEIAEKPRLSLVTLKKYLVSDIRKKLQEVLPKEVEMQEITFNQPEVKSLIESSFAVGEGKKQESFGKQQSQLTEEENILSQLQSGNISLENAEKLLLGMTEEKIPEKAKDAKAIEPDRYDELLSEELLSLVSAGEISLEAAENLLLEVVEPELKTESNELDINDNRELEDQTEKLLNQLQLGEISLENAESIILSLNEEKLPVQTTTKSQVNKYENKLINPDNSEELLSLVSSGEISLEAAENLLLEVAPEIKKEVIKEVNSDWNDIGSIDIAIIGISCRYPGANNWREFWENLKNGVDSVTEAPPGRWEEKNWYHPDPEHPGTSYSKYAGFLDEIDKFDPLFFKISPEEAQFVEPQQRIFLEEAYHAIEDAGYATDSLKGEKCGVFVGASTGDYLKLLSIVGLETHRFVLTGNLLSLIPARIAYFLDLKGPVATIDTSCSSSLVAIHQACESIQKGESKIAIAGGISICATADFQIASSQFQMISPDGCCKTFDASASGTTWSEGCGVILLKSYSQAVQDKDRIYGVIKGTGVNYDGNTNGISAPSSQSQASLEAAVYQKFGINPETISYVEAHGTATPLGDPIEVEALTEAFSKWTNKKHFCAIGSVKSNIGHASTAAGVSGLIKTILCLKNQKLVPSLHFEQPNPHIDFENSPFYVNTELKDWEVSAGEPRKAAVSSFGFSGTNAHIVIEEAPSEVRSQKSKIRSEEDLERSLHLLTLSAKTENSLKDLVSSYQSYLETNVETFRETSLHDICYTAATGRTHFNHRLGAIASDPKELIEKLVGWKTNEELVGVFSGETNKKSPKIAFLFTGQGSQYVNMGRQLYEQAPTFRQALDECDQILQPYLEVPLLEVIYPQDAQKLTADLLDQTAYTQPALFSLEYALFKLWESWGVKPDVVMGHSVGEYVAATVARVFSLEDGLKLIAMRGKLMQKLPSGGEMVSVMASESQVMEAITEYSSQVTIAAFNGPNSIVISGEGGAIAKICSEFKAVKVKTKKLQVSHAFHSPLMEPMLTEFGTVAEEITYNQPKISIISNVTGTKVGTEITTAEYWVSHVCQSVKFAQSMKTIEEQGYQTFLEIGPKPILLGMGRRCVTEDVGEWLPSLRPGVDEWEQVLSSLGQLYVKGVKIDWSGFDSDYSRQKVVLPTYPFQRERYWIETNNNLKFWPQQQLPKDQNFHPLLGQKLNCASQQQIFASQIGENLPNYLSHHRVFDQAIFPTTAYLEIAIAAGNHQFKTPQIVIEDLTISKGWTLPAGELTNSQTILTPLEDQSYQFQIFSQQEQHDQEEQKWRLHATGNIRTAQTDTTPTKVELEKYKAECSQAIEVKQHYQQYRQLGVDYGSSFQGVYELWSGKNEALAQIKLPEELIAETINYQFHPALLETALQIIIHAMPEVESDKTYLTVGIEQFKVYRSPGLSLYAHVSVLTPTVESQNSLTAQVTLVSPEGEIIATVKGLQVKQATQQTLLGTEVESITNCLYEVEWRTKGLLGRLLPPDFLLAPVEVSQKLTSSIKELVTQVDNARTSERERSLEELSVDYIVQALVSMDWSYKPTESFDLEEVVQRLGIVPSQRRLFGRLLQILEEVGILKYEQQQWQVQRTLEQVNPREQNQSLLSQYPEEAAALTLLNRCASKLRGVLKGAIEPLELVFPKGDWMAAKVYQDSIVAQTMNTIVQKTIAQSIEYLPPSRGIRVLEIGAGTGETTSYILPYLNPNQTEYVFTDINPLLTRQAQQKFQDYKFLDYQTLDIEVEPTSQGFASHQYDVIIAANVLYATTSMKQTLSHVQQLLAPGGTLVLYERTTRSRFLDLSFGLLEEWWKFSDHELRSDYPLLSRSQWKQVLSETGFTQVVTMPEVERLTEVFAQQGVIVAQAPPTTLSSTPKSWLILVDKQGVAQQLASQLRSVGDICTLVFAGENYQELAPEEFIINPHNPEEFEKLIETVATRSPSLSGVVQCWPTEAGVGKNLSAEELEHLSKLGCGTTLFLVQTLVKAKLSKLPRLWLVTNGSQAVLSNNSVIPGVAHSSLWGMGKVISLEHPELKCVRVDLDLQDTIDNQVEALFQEILSEDKEDQVAWRGDERYVARLVASTHQQAVGEQQAGATTQKSLRFREDATYLITEGIGSLGLLVARWMVDKGAKHLVLLGNCSPDGTNSQTITELEKAGASVLAEKVDVSDMKSIAGVLHKIKESNIPLVGVIHSSGILLDGMLKDMVLSDFEEAITSKIKGAWHLHELTQNQQLDFFVLFSSVASLLGSPSQGNHALVNGFLDGLAHYRRGIGLPGLSIHWGTVDQGGENVSLQQQGIAAISPTQALESLEILMSGSEIEAGVLPIEWSAWQERLARLPFLADWQETTKTTSEIFKSEFLARLEATAPNERHSLLLAHVRRQFALVLGIKNPESISLETGFFDLGMDSLTSVELRNKLQISLDCTLPSSLAFDYPNIQSLTDYLEQTILLPPDDTSYESETPEAILDKDSLELESAENLFYEVDQLPEDEIDLAVDEAIDQLDKLLE
jgi:malonyl CoA-acyl carrier protein transacylase